LKIAYFVNQYPKVSHSFIRREILELERQGFEVQRLAIHGWDEPLPDIADQRERDQTLYVLRHGILGLALPVLRTLFTSPLRLLLALRTAVRLSRESDRPFPYHFAYIAEACRIVPWMREFGACRVHAHFGNNSTEVVLLAHILGGPPYSFTIHGPGEFSQPVGLTEKIRGSSFVVAVSSFGRSQLLLRASQEDWRKITVIRCGLETAFFDVPPHPVTTVPRLVCIGRLCAEKGQVLLIEAAARIVGAGVPLELVLAGDGPMRSELERQIAKHGLGPHVQITGWVSGDRVREELLAARALVLPSFAEGLPVVLMEAMALRRPVLATYIAGIPELVEPGRSGWLVPAGSVDELVAAMQECLALPPAVIREMGDAGHDRIIARHLIKSEVSKLAELFRSSELRVNA